MSRFLLAPSIISADFGRLAEEVRAAEEAGADWIHLDIMDGHFVPNLTIGPDVVRAVREITRLPLDVHLMVEEPQNFVRPFIAAGASAVGVHVEVSRHTQRLCAEIRELGARPCIVLNPETPAEAIQPVLPDVDQVLVMTVNPGFGGQSLIPATLPKIARIRSWIEATGRPIDLVVDGGIGPDTVEQVAVHGANVFVMGSAFFKSSDYKLFADSIRAILAPYTNSSTPPGSEPASGAGPAPKGP